MGLWEEDIWATVLQATHTRTPPQQQPSPLGFLGYEEPRMLWAAAAVQGPIPGARGLVEGRRAGLLPPPTPLP